MAKTRRHRHVFPWSAGRRPQTPAEASQEASLKIQRPQGAGRPCYEAGNSACRGEWRREAGSQCAPNASTGKRAWRTPIPNLSPFDRKVGRGLFVFKKTGGRVGCWPGYWAINRKKLLVDGAGSVT